MKSTISMHPLVTGISNSTWARYSDARRMYENRKALRNSQTQVSTILAQVAEQVKP